MTQNEFQLWIRWHGARFPQWASWLAGADQRSSASPGMPTGAEVIAAMFEILADVALVDAKQASTALAKGDEPPPKAFEDHPQAVRAVGRRRANDRLRAEPKFRYVNGEPTYRCSRCCDSGILTIWHPDTMRAARNTPDLLLDRAIPFFTAATACSCDKGSRMRSDRLAQITPWMIELPDYLDMPGKLRALVEQQAEHGGQTKVYDFD